MTTEVENNVDNTEKGKEVEEGAAEGAKETPAEPEKKPERKAEPPKPGVHKADFEKDVVYLYQLSRTPQLPSTSPYCLKLETWLRLAGLKYENVEHKAKFRSKKGQLPFVELNGEEIADSSFIIKELSQKFEKDLDAGLTAEQRAVSHAMTSMVENHLSWAVVWWRARYPDSVLRGYRLNLQDALNTRLPNSILNFCYKITSQRKGLKKARAHGIGVHSQAEIVDLATADLRALADLLADKHYFFGDEPTLLDVVVFAHLAQLQYVCADIEHALRDVLNQFPTLVALVTRVQERAFPDWRELLAPEPSAKDKETKDKESKDKENKDTKEKEKEKEEKEKAPADDAEKGKGEEKELEPEEKEAENEKDK